MAIEKHGQKFELETTENKSSKWPTCGPTSPTPPTPPPTNTHTHTYPHPTQQ